MEDIPYMAVGNEQLGEPIEEVITCSICNEQHIIHTTVSKIELSYYICSGKSYIYGINRRKIGGMNDR